jgi:hypothetical protein
MFIEQKPSSSSSAPAARNVYRTKAVVVIFSASGAECL